MKALISGEKVLVTGGSGYIAANLIRNLVSRGEVVRRWSRRKRENRDQSFRVEDFAADLTERASWLEALEGVQTVFHLAAQTSVRQSADDADRDHRINVLPMLCMLEACRSLGCNPAVIFTGTVTEAGVPSTLPVSEDHPDCPVTVYDLHKWMAEKYLSYYSRTGCVRGVTLRLSNVYGPGPESSSRERGVLNLMIRRALQNKQLQVYGEGKELRDYVFVDDVAKALITAAEHADEVSGHYFVVGSGEAVSIKTAIELVASRVREKTGREVPVRVVDPPACLSAIDARNFRADTTRFSEATGWAPRVALADGIDRTIDFYLSGESF